MSITLVGLRRGMPSSTEAANRIGGPSWAVDRPSPLQNRVTPFGEIVAEPSRGLLMGNRGCIHGTDRRLGRARWRSKLWICCVLSWRDVRRDVMPPGRWTALFFLDEATALSAGHRPCGYCRREDHLAFADAWRLGHGLDVRPRAAELDVLLHAERVDSRTRQKRTRAVALDSLPDGAMVEHEGAPSLVLGGALLRWSFEGYEPPRRIARSTGVRLLTPPGVVAAIAAGYRPLVHPSAGAAPGVRALPPTAPGGVVEVADGPTARRRIGC